MKKKEIIILISIIFVWIVFFVGVNINRNKMLIDGFSKDLIPQIKESSVLKQEIGSIKTIKGRILYTPKSLGNNTGENKYLIKTDKGSFKVTVVVGSNGKKWIPIKYKVNGKTIEEKSDK